MHGISMNSLLEVVLLLLRKYMIQGQQGQGQGQMIVMLFMNCQVD